MDDQPKWKTNAYGQQVLAENYNGIQAGLPQDVAQAQIDAQKQPGYAAASQQHAQEMNAYGVARDASLGMMNPGSMGANGTDYGKAQSDPSAAGRAFAASGYTPQQALQDGWGTGVGTPGWQNTPQSQHLNPTGGNMAAMNPQDPNWGKPAVPTIAQQLGPQYAGGSSAPPNPPGGGQQQGGIYQQLGAQLGPQSPPSGGQGGNPFGALQSYLSQRSQGGYGGPAHQPAQLNHLGAPQTMPLSSFRPNANVLSSLAGQLAPPGLNHIGAPQTMPLSSFSANPNVLAALGSHLGMMKPPGA